MPNYSKNQRQYQSNSEPIGAIVTNEMQPLLNKKQVAIFLNVSTRTVEKYVSRGTLRSVKIDGSRRFRPKDVESFIDARLTGTEVEVIK